MQYPQLPTNLKQASYQDLARADSALRQYKNVTILGIKHWRAIPQLKDAIKVVNRDQRRVLKEIKARPEFHKVIKPSVSGREIYASLHAQSQTPQPEKLNKHDRVHSKYHNADGELITVEYSSRVGWIYMVLLDNGETVCVAREDLSKIESEA